MVTSLPGLDADTLYEDIYCARGQAENYIKHLKGDLAADRTSCTSFLANCMRLLLHAAAYVLHLPSACTVKHLLQTLTERLYLPMPTAKLNSS